MGNTHAFLYRLPALLTAFFSASGLALLALSGITCAFVEVRAHEGKILYVPDSLEPSVQTSTYLGVLCGSEVFALEEDIMWIISRIGLFIALAMGSCTNVLAWSLSIFIAPTVTNWRLLSVLAAITSVLQMPIFLVFETEPCTEYRSEQQCKIAFGSFFLILSTFLWVAITLVTQLMDPPLWAIELDAWRVNRKSNIRGAHDLPLVGNLPQENPDDQEMLLAPKRLTMVEKYRKWSLQRSGNNIAGIPNNTTESTSDGGMDFQTKRICDTQSYYATSNDSRLLLKVLPGGKRPGDDNHSAHSFEDLDSFVKLAEEERVERERLGQLPPSRGAFSKNELSTEDIHKDTPSSDGVVLDTDKVASCGTQPLAINSALVLYEDDPEEIPVPKIASSQKPSRLLPVSAIWDLTEKVKNASQNFRKSRTYAALSDDEDDSDPHIPAQVVFTQTSETEDVPLEQFGDEEFKSLDRDAAQFPCYNWQRSHSMDSSCSDELLESNDSLDSEDYIKTKEIGSGEIDDDPRSRFDAAFDVHFGTDDKDFELPGYGPIETNSTSMTDDGNADLEALVARVVCQQEYGRRRRRRRSRSRGLSASHSVASATSLLDITIEEETAADLKEWESEDEQPYPFVKARSAPTPTANIPGNEIEDVLISEHPSPVDCPMDEHNTPLHTNNVPSETEDETNRKLPSAVDCPTHNEVKHKEEQTRGSEENALETETTTPEQVGIVLPPQEATTQTLVLPATKPPLNGRPPLSPAKKIRVGSVTCWPEDSHLVGEGDNLLNEKMSETSRLIEAIDDLLSWKEERSYRDGIHARHDEVDSPSDEDDVMTPSIRDQARTARMQRLQQSNAINRTRSRTLEPRRRKRHIATMGSSVIASLDLQLIEVLRPEGLEYGPDEVSL